MDGGSERRRSREGDQLADSGAAKTRAGGSSPGHELATTDPTGTGRAPGRLGSCGSPSEGCLEMSSIPAHQRELHGLLG